MQNTDHLHLVWKLRKNGCILNTPSLMLPWLFNCGSSLVRVR